MKIALVILHADPRRGGAERYTFDLAAGLAGRGHEMRLLASTFGSKPAGVTCVELGERGLTRLAKYRHFLDAVDFEVDGRYADTDVIHAMLPVRRCDVYHPHAGLAVDAVESGHLKHAGLVKQWLAKAGNRVNWKRNAFAQVERALLGETRVDHARGASSSPVVLCLSDYVKETLRRHYPNLPESKMATLFNAVDLEKFNPAQRPEAKQMVRGKLGIGGDRVVALMVAQDFERKGVREAIAALGRVENKGLVLLVVGKPDASAYQKQARELALEQRVIFVGGTDDVYSFYAAADFFVLPTRHDPCSLVVLEALAMGVPVISTRQNGACEIMETGRHGFVLESADDAAGLDRAMEAMCDQGRREQMREACLALRPRLAYGAHLEALLEIYGRVRVK